MIYLKDAYETKFSKYMFSFSTCYQYHRYVIAVIPYIVSVYVACLDTEFDEARKMNNFFFSKKIFFFSNIVIYSIAI